VQIKEKNIEQQIQLWAIAGPFVTLLTLLVSMMKASPMQPSFAVCLLLGLPLCWKWKLKGLAISMGLLLGTIAFYVVDLDFSACLWSAGLGVSATLSFLVTALSFDEVSALTDTLQVESKSRLDNLLKLDEKFKVEKESHYKKNEKFLSNIKELEDELVKTKNRAASNERLAQIVREELATTHSRNDELLQEVFDWRHKHGKIENEIKSLREDARVAKESVDKSEVDAAYEEISSLETQLTHAREQLETVQAQFEYSEEERQAHEIALQEKTEEFDKLEGELEEIRVLYESSQEQAIQLKDQVGNTHQHEEELAKAQKLLEEQNQQLESMQLTLDERVQELLLEKQKIEEIHANASEKEMVLQQLVQEAKTERDEVKKKLEKASKKESPDLRKVKGKHTQLQKQFNEKSEVLDETRRALFHMQEKLLTAQRETEEARKSDHSDTEQLLEQSVEKMEGDRTQLEKNHQQEIDDLHEIIASLSASNSS
jgi:chromosome segregation ATPase